VTTNNDGARPQHLRDFYAVLDDLAATLGGPSTLASCNGRSAWLKRGIYFFFEPGEIRTDSGAGARVVRVGTHALTATSSSTLWGRLSQHRGQAKSGGGNHRGSIFRLIVGASLIERKSYLFPTWGQGSSAPSEVRAGELALELEVSKVIGAMPFLWLAVDDQPGPDSARGLIERNAIALLSNFGKAPLDPPSAGWLGHQCNREKVRKSGLWNSNHVDEVCDPCFLDVMAGLVAKVGRRD
jgi:hypothetical protein